MIRVLKTQWTKLWGDSFIPASYWVINGCSNIVCTAKAVGFSGESVEGILETTKINKSLLKISMHNLINYNTRVGKQVSYLYK